MKSNFKGVNSMRLIKIHMRFIRIIPLILIALSAFIASASAQQPMRDDDGFEIFEYQDGDTVYLMKKYYMCILLRGETPDLPPEELMAIQKGHLQHLSKMADEGKICLAGPFEGDGEMRGIAVYSTTTMEEAVRLAEEDPAVQAGRLKVQVLPWWAAKGTSLY